MIEKKSDTIIKPKKLVVKIEDFSKGINLDKDQNVLNPNYCVSVYNYALNKGALTESYGLKNLECPNYANDEINNMEQDWESTWVDLRNVWFYKMYDKYGRADKLMFYGSDKGLYFSHIITESPSITGYFENKYAEKPTFCYNIKYNNVDYNLFGSENMGVYKVFNNKVPVLMENFPNLSSMCEDKEKLFGCGYGERNFVYYHTNKIFLGWTTTDEDSGKIEMNDERGKINRVIPFLGYVFAIRDYGISKIINYENKTDFDVVHLSLSGSKIYENTASICGDKMIYLSKDGLCSFNGVSSKILPISVNDMFINQNNDNAIGVFYSGKYYLACRLDFADNNKVGCENEANFKNNALLILNTETNKFEILRGLDIASMCAVQFNSMDKIAIILNSIQTQRVFELDKSGKLYNTILTKEWISPLTDLGYSDKIKFVRDLSVLSKFDAFVTIFTEKESRTFKILGSDMLNKIRVNVKGKQIGIKIKSVTDKAYIANLNLNIDLLEYGFNSKK